MGMHSKIKDSKGKRPLSQRALILTGTFLALLALYFLCSVLAAALPKETIVQHIEDSQGSQLTQYFDYDHEILGSNVSFDNNRFIEAFAKQDSYGGDAVKAAALNRIEYTMPGSATVFEYFRYWHGWQLPVFLLLMIGDLNLVAIALGLFAIGSALFFFLQLRWYIGWVPAGVFSLVSFLSTNILGNFMGDLLLSLSISTVVLCCAISLKAGRNPNRGIFWQDCICLVSASLFCFFDFFTIPAYAIAMAVFSAMLASGCLEGSFKRGVGLFIRFTAIFLASFILTWVGKWAFAAFYLGVPLVIENIFGEILLWSGSEADDSAGALRDTFPRTYALAKSGFFVLYYVNPGRTMHWNVAGIAGAFIFLIGAILIIVSIVKSRKSRKPICGGVWSAMIPALYVPVAIALMYHHVIFHTGIFGYKPWAFFLADIACIGFYLILERRKKGLSSLSGISS